MTRSEQAKPRAGFGGALDGLDAWLGRWLGNPVMIAVLALGTAWWAMSGHRLDRIHNGLPYEEQNFVREINAAAENMAEGCVPLREVPWAGKVAGPVFHRYALFQFYGQFPFILAALLVNFGMLSYHAMLALGFLSYFAGFTGACLLGRAMSLRPASSLALALLFTLAPYHLTVWYGRFAMTEHFALGLMPWVFYGALRSYQRQDLLSLLFSAFTWQLIMLSHTITFIFCTLIVFGVLGAQWLFFERERLQGLLRAALGHGLGWVASAWGLAPVVLLGPHLGVNSQFLPRDYAYLTQLKVLLSKGFFALPQAGFMGLQVGWPSLAAMGLGLLLAIFRRRWLACALLAWLSFLLAWHPKDYFGSLGPLAIIQFPYRMLGFLALLAALLLGGLWNELRRFGNLLLPALAAAIFYFALPYVSGGDGVTSAEAISSGYAQEGLQYQGPAAAFAVGDLRSAWIEKQPNAVDLNLSALPNSLSLAEGLDLRTAAPVPLSYTPAPLRSKAHAAPLSPTAQPSAATGSVQFGRVTTVEAHALQPGDVLLLPAPWYPNLYDFRINGRPAPHARVADRLAVQVPQGGDLKLSFRFRGLAWANGLSALCWVVFGLLLVLHFLGWDWGRLLARLGSSAAVPGPAKPGHPSRRKQ